MLLMKTCACSSTYHGLHISGTVRAASDIMKNRHRKKIEYGNLNFNLMSAVREPKDMKTCTPPGPHFHHLYTSSSSGKCESEKKAFD